MMKNIYEKAVKLVGYDGTTEEAIEYYENAQDFRENTQFETDEDFQEYVLEKFSVDVKNLNRPFILLDSIGSADGTIFTSDDDEEYILDTIQKYFK